MNSMLVLALIVAAYVFIAVMERNKLPAKPPEGPPAIRPVYWCFEFDTRSVSGTMGMSRAWGYGVTRERALDAIHRTCPALRGKIVRCLGHTEERPVLRYRIHGERDYRNPTLAFIAGRSPIVDRDSNCVATMMLDEADVQDATNWPMLRSTFQRGAVRMVVRTSEGHVPLQDYLT